MINNTSRFKVVKIPKSELKIYSFFVRNGYFWFSLIFLFISIVFLSLAVKKIETTEIYIQIKKLWFYLFVLSIGFFMMFLCLYDACKNISILKNGILTEAKVDKIKEVEPDEGTSFFMYLILFSDHNNELHRVKKRSNNLKNLKSIKLVYKESNPDKVVFLDEIFVKYGNEKSELINLINTYSSNYF